jgi:hypothetical protein
MNNARIVTSPGICTSLIESIDRMEQGWEDLIAWLRRVSRIRAGVARGQGRAKRVQRQSLEAAARRLYKELGRRSEARCTFRLPQSRSTAPEAGIPARCGAGSCCTTERHKAHKTDSAKVIYPWHPFHEREVTVHGERNRRGAIVLICSAGDETKAPLEIPEWMFDPALGCTFRSGQSAHVTCGALRCLRTTLDSIAGVIEAQHQSTFTGGSDAQTNESSETTRSVSSDSRKRESASINGPQTTSFTGPTVSSIHKRKRDRYQPTGARP